MHRQPNTNLATIGKLATVYKYKDDERANAHSCCPTVQNKNYNNYYNNTIDLY